jgi:hypothetical protein
MNDVVDKPRAIVVPEMVIGIRRIHPEREGKHDTACGELCITGDFGSLPAEGRCAHRLATYSVARIHLGFSNQVGSPDRYSQGTRDAVALFKRTARKVTSKRSAASAVLGL